jgi:hypothetical protein
MFDFSVGDDMFPRNALAKEMTPEEYACNPVIEGEAELVAALEGLTGYLNVRDELLEIQHSYGNVDFASVNKDLIMMQVTRHLPEHMKAMVTVDDFASMESIKEKFASFKAGAAALIDRIWTAIKNFFTNLFNQAERQYQKAVKVRDKVKAMKNANLDSFKITPALAPFMGQGMIMFLGAKQLLEGTRHAAAFNLENEGRGVIDHMGKELKTDKPATDIVNEVGKGLEGIYKVTFSKAEKGLPDEHRLSLVAEGASGYIGYNPKTNTFAYKVWGTATGKEPATVLKKFPQVCLPVAEGAVSAFDQIRDKSKIAKLESEIQALKSMEGLQREKGETARLVNFVFTYFKAIVDYQYAMANATLYLAASVKDGNFAE